MRKAIGWAVVVICTTLGTATSAMAIETSTTVSTETIGMKEGRVSFTPFGFKKFCRVERVHCAAYQKASSADKAQVKLTPARLAELERINTSVNRDIRQIPEMRFFSTSYKDEWKLPTTSGDCEDLALLKQKRLIELGWPENALLITVADMPGGIRHAVLTVRTGEGDLILDNTTDEIRDWREVDYRWIKRQSTRNMMRWVEIRA